MRFIRFSYFVDFLSMQSLKKIYDDSLNEFQSNLLQKAAVTDIFILKEQTREIRSSIDPVFQVDLEGDFFDMPAMR